MKPNQIALAKAMPKFIFRDASQKATLRAPLRAQTESQSAGFPPRNGARPKVAWCIPLEESIYSAWFTHFMTMDSAPNDKIITVEGAFIDTARNNLVELFLKTDAEYLFFLDSDTCPPVDAVDRLLACATGNHVEGHPQGGRPQEGHPQEGHPQGVPLRDRPIVAGWYNVKKRPHHPCVFDYVGWNAEKQWHDYRARENALEDPAAPPCALGCGRRHGQVVERVDAIGFGCVLLRRDVFTTITRQPRGEVAQAEGAETAPLQNVGGPPNSTNSSKEFGGGSPTSLKQLVDVGGGWFTTSEGGTEDMAFCRRAAKAGVPIFVDWSIHCEHIGLVKI